MQPIGRNIFRQSKHVSFFSTKKSPCQISSLFAKETSKHSLKSLWKFQKRNYSYARDALRCVAISYAISLGVSTIGAVGYVLVYTPLKENHEVKKIAKLQEIERANALLEICKKEQVTLLSKCLEAFEVDKKLVNVCLKNVLEEKKTKKTKELLFILVKHGAEACSELLTFAIEEGSCDLVHLLIDKGVDVNKNHVEKAIKQGNGSILNSLAKNEKAKKILFQAVKTNA